MIYPEHRRRAWTKSQIQSARKFPLAPILRQRGITLHELAGDNYRVDPYHDLIVKDNYWIWKSKNLHGNTIDFFVFVKKLSFAQTMNLLNPK